MQPHVISNAWWKNDNRNKCMIKSCGKKRTDKLLLFLGAEFCKQFNITASLNQLSDFEKKSYLGRRRTANVEYLLVLRQRIWPHIPKCFFCFLLPNLSTIITFYKDASDGFWLYFRQMHKESRSHMKLVWFDFLGRVLDDHTQSIHRE